MSQAKGVVERIDLIAREVEVRMSDCSVVLDVPAGCPIVLRGERIKLRLLQKNDRIIASYRRVSGRIEACRLDVQPDRTA